ncbi:signal transduction protein with CBS domains [Halostagnicola sp. A56]|uniref:CBS domain-containing protein n=1 Tax=Halostagnicola sp. A56 TaxID=1495067 RepID=UPI00049F00BA|nr:CBS domain-containing protein [Halostagnicola sp. A56]KDE60251.1 signal transduction protein with CBS domains [Halostagnicola sp. A56]
MEPELSVSEVLTTEYVGVSESDTVLGAVRLMREERVGCVLVLRGSEPVGIVTEWDVLGLVAAEEAVGETTVDTVMSTPVISVAGDRPLTDAADLMARENIRNLLVEAETDVLGVLTQRDVIAAAGSFQATTSRSVSESRPADESLTGGASITESMASQSGADTEIRPNGGDEYSTQGICEACGSLADSLWETNGQLVCADCRSV